MTQQSRDTTGDSKATDCECINYAWDGRPPILEHHRRCKEYTAEFVESRSVAIVKRLVVGIENWGKDCDGIPEELYRDYLKALAFLGQINKIASILQNDTTNPGR